jgi:lipopolysaccharide/colanic/teichoic acid biosynthesis glycosyltransferase
LNHAMFYEITKRILDVVISFFALLVFSPFALVICLLIILEDGWPVIYVQDRVGRDRRPFKIYKFRSMVKNADEILFSDRKLYEAMRSGSHKLEDDHRVTRIGRFIRKYSIDEFPQFINVLRGEMSVVGPRAYRPDELEKYERDNPHIKEALEKILTVNPGITGLWQVGGRSEVVFDERIQIERKYAESCSIFLDLYILLRTPLAVLQAKGAA